VGAKIGLAAGGFRALLCMVYNVGCHCINLAKE
jgi:hypothetical protein